MSHSLYCLMIFFSKNCILVTFWTVKETTLYSCQNGTECVSDVTKKLFRHKYWYTYAFQGFPVGTKVDEQDPACVPNAKYTLGEFSVSNVSYVV